MADRRQKDVKNTDPRQGSKQKAKGPGDNSSSVGTKAPSATRPSRVDPNPPVRRQSPATDNSITNAAVASTSTSVPAAVPRTKTNHVILDYKAPDVDVLYKELHQNYRGQAWFDSYDSFEKLWDTSSKTRKTTRLAKLPVLMGKKKVDGSQHVVNLHDTVLDTISYLLDIEAWWNPVTMIKSTPHGCSSALWKGNLWLGGIKDSINVEDVLTAHKISAVVSIHPEDGLADKAWASIFTQWKGVKELKPGWTGLKDRGQYLIALKDNSSEPLAAYFQKAFKFMDYYLSKGENVLVHCKMGQSRSASLLLGYMVTKCYERGMHTNAAYGPSPDTIGRLKTVLKVFTDEISMPLNEPDKSAQRQDTFKRRGISTKNFKDQLEQYFRRLSTGAASGGENDSKSSASQPKPHEKKGGGGILKDAIIVLCFMHDLKPTREVVEYWNSRKGTNTRYWIAASEDKSRKNGLQVTNHLGHFHGFFGPCVSMYSTS